MNWTKRALGYTVSILLTVVLLEAGSAFILNVVSKDLELAAVQDEFVFKRASADGSFKPTKDYVLPIRENARFQWVAPEFSVEVRTNSAGLREDFEVQHKDVGVAFFGDSFTFGHGVSTENRYTNVFAEHLKPADNRRTVSFSYKNGFQPEHYEYFFRNNPDLQPKHVIVGLYLGNDFGADVLETVYDPDANTLLLPYRRVHEAGQIGNSPSVFRFPLNTLADRSHFAKFLLKVVGKTPFRSYVFQSGFDGPNSPNAVEIEKATVDLSAHRTTKSLLRLKAHVESRGGQLTVLIIPQNYFFGDDNAHLHPELKGRVSELRSGRNLLVAMREVCASQKLDCFDPSPILERSDYFPKDAHWTAGANEKIGRALAAYLSGKS